MTVLDSPTSASRLYERVHRVIPPIEWPAFEADIEAILSLKRKRDAIILAHNYQTPEIFHCVADVVGDSLMLAREAAKGDARVIVMAGVHFMAETAKLLNPSKMVLIPDARAGCSLAESIDADDIRLMRERYPGAPVVTYVNTSAEVKAASDICCTSANAVKVVESLGAPRVIMTPDEYLAKNVAAQTAVDPLTQVPMLGASGAISAVLAAYLFLYPRSPITVINPIPILWLFWGLFLQFPAWLVIGEFFVVNLWSALTSSTSQGGVAFMAHVGGFVGGAALFRLFMIGRPRMDDYERHDHWAQRRAR